MTPPEPSTQASNSSTQEDSKDPLFLHHLDNPGIILVSQCPTVANYGPWSRAMKLALNAKNKLGFIDGPLSMPTSDSTNPPSPSAISKTESLFRLKLKDDEWLNIYRRVERFKGTSTPDDHLPPDFAKASPDSVPVKTSDGSSTTVRSKDVVIFPSTKVSARLYLPQVAESPPKRVPILVYFHGGGFVIESTGSPKYHNHLNRVAAKASFLIVSVNYRLAPEHPLPAAYDDCMAALNWVVSHSTGTGPEPWLTEHGDFSTLYLAGDSAGGNVTHYVGMRADDGVNIEGVALVNPYFFGSEPVGKEKADPGSMLFHQNLWRLICPESDGFDDPRVNPFGPTAPSLKGLKSKRVAVFVAGKDFHADRGRLYHETLVRSGWPAGGERVAYLVEDEELNHVEHLEHPDNEICQKMEDKMVNFFKGKQPQ